MDTLLAQALSQATLYTDEQPYCMIHLPLSAAARAAGLLAESATPFSGLLIDKDEVTLILAENILASAWDRLSPHEVTCDYRLITFDLLLDFSLVGFMSIVSSALAAAGIPILAFSAYERDHLLIQQPDFEKALATLHLVQTQAHQKTLSL